MPESRFSVGNVEIVGLTDIEVEFMPLTQLFPHVPLAAWTPHQQRYRGISASGYLASPFRGFLVRSQDGPFSSTLGWEAPSPTLAPSPCLRAGRMGICWTSCRPLGSVPRTSTPCS